MSTRTELETELRHLYERHDVALSERARALREQKQAREAGNDRDLPRSSAEAASAMARISAVEADIEVVRKALGVLGAVD